MKILIAPDKFKCSLGAKAVAENIAAGLREKLPEAQPQILPVADGGEGTAEVICAALEGNWIECTAHDSLGRAINAHYAWIDHRKLTIIEMSEAAGLRRLSESERDPLRGTTSGVGEMLLDAASRGAREIVIGLGGSATNDGGFGTARALGFQFFDNKKKEFVGGVPDLIGLSHISAPSNPELPQITVAADVKNPLLGEHGASRVFAPQKGANPDQVELLERALTRLADVVSHDLKCDFRDMPGAGAAGGLGFGLLSFCGATMRSGFDVVAEEIKLEEAIRQAEIIVTGEGSLDHQTLEGKAPLGVARLARKQGKRVFAIVGQSTRDPEVEGLFEKVFSLTRGRITQSESIERTRELLRERAGELALAF
jgi:glycerate kinase